MLPPGKVVYEVENTELCSCLGYGAREKVVLNNVRFLSHEGPRVAGRRQREQGQKKRSEQRSEAITTQETGARGTKAQKQASQRSTATRLALVDASLAV